MVAGVDQGARAAILPNLRPLSSLNLCLIASGLRDWPVGWLSSTGSASDSAFAVEAPDELVKAAVVARSSS